MPVNTKSSLLAGTLAAIGASACCVGPLVLLALGIGGTWVSRLTTLEPYSPIFIGLTLLFLGRAFHQLYLAQPACTPGQDQVCTDQGVRRRQRLLFWLCAIPLLALLAFPWYAPLFY